MWGDASNTSSRIRHAYLRRPMDIKIEGSNTLHSWLRFSAVLISRVWFPPSPRRGEGRLFRIVVAAPPTCRSFTPRRSVRVPMICLVWSWPFRESVQPYQGRFCPSIDH